MFIFKRWYVHTRSVHLDMFIFTRGVGDYDVEVDLLESPDGAKFFIPKVDDDLKPKINDKFTSVKEAESMCRRYAEKSGFDVRLDAKKTNKYGDIQTRWFVCSKEGIPNEIFFDSIDLRPRDRRYSNSNLKRSGCKACVKIHLTKDRSTYEIYEFVEAHNHVLFNTNDRRFSRKNRQMQYIGYKHVLNSSSYKVGATRAHRYQTVLKGGFEQCRPTCVDYKNFRRDAASFVGNKDAKMLLNKLANRRNIVPEYFFEYKCNGRELNALFWADEFTRLNYKEFGDVISFDGTFRTNLHCMIFVPFIAVDNHKSYVVVGSALINGETIDNFNWVLRAFLSCHGKQPVFVITDQCAAMRQAIPLVFTESRHRLCMWHIMNKVPNKVSIALKYNPEFNRVINKLVWNVKICPEEFESQWKSMIENYGLLGDKWFDYMYEIRRSWIPAFYKDTPMSGLMKTTSRSESANAYVNIYLSSFFDLVQFLNNYDIAIENQRYAQAVDESVTRTTTPRFCSPLGIEVHASKIYSRSIFFDFQKELKKALLCCIIEGVESFGEMKTFLISRKSKPTTYKTRYTVERNYSENTVECQCRFFVRNGYLCRHSLAVLINDKVDRIPEKYILRRWTQNLVPVQMQSAHARYKEGDTEKEDCIRDVYTQVDDIVSRARNDKSLLDNLAELLRNFKLDVETKLPYEDPSQQKIDAIKEHLGVDVPDEVDILPPTRIRNKGCGTGKRLISASEKVQTNSKKPKRKCAKCGQCAGHDSRNCPNV
ncbi:hypothetical protein L6452_21205 [Arctium lappa]|uniref:Uncharacterized protein n=1 Tax=Arctium lappa TaxID=4217 RepID=A0ACB9BDK5_ARCLA|nr:hypothetical protein L6452_21205 [Arctium lappa]